MSSSANPALAGQAVTFTVNASGTLGAATGTVTFMDDMTVLGTATLDASGNATFTTSSLTAGSHNISANYGGDSNYDGNSASLMQTINQPTSSMTLSSSASPAEPGQAVTFTANVSGSGVMPTGTVTFMDGMTTLGTATLDASGNVIFTTSSLTAGSHSITANYSGDTNYESNSAYLTQFVGQQTSSVMLSSSANPIPQYQAVTFTANVSGDSLTPTGTVTFQAGTTTLGTVTLDASGNASFTTSTLAQGSYTITAVYNGDNNYTGSSGTLEQVIDPPNNGAFMSLSSSAGDTALPGQDVTFTVQFNNPNVTPTGTVIFQDGTTTLGTVTVDSYGFAQFTTSALTLGSHTINAIYSGDSNNYGTTVSMTQVVNYVLPSMSLGAQMTPQWYGLGLELSASVTAPGDAPPTGSVSFYDGTTMLSTATLDGGEAFFTTAVLSLGNHDFKAVYTSDNGYSSASASLTQTIAPWSTGVVFSAWADPQVGETLTAQVVVPGGTPTGNVFFYDGLSYLGSASVGGDGSASLVLPEGLSAGTHALTAIYLGDGTYGGSASATFSQTIGDDQTSRYDDAIFPMTSNPFAAPGQAVTFTAIVTPREGYMTPTGRVLFLDGGTDLGTVTLDANGQATVSTSTLGLGSHTITMLYSGDGNYYGTSAFLTQSIEPATTSMSLTSSNASPGQGGEVTFTATVSSSGGTPTGNVTFMDGATVLGSATLVNGQATLTNWDPALGIHDIIAVYAGDGVAFSGSSSSVEETVEFLASSTSLSPATLSVTEGQQVTYSAIVVPVPMGAPMPTGTVNFYDGTTLLGTATLTLVNGQAEADFTAAAMGLGSHTIYADYSGDDNFTASEASVEETVS